MGAPRASAPAALLPSTRPAKTARADTDRDVRASVAALGASGFELKAKRARASSALEAIGAVVKKQRMPFKMMIGVDRARAVRAARADEEARASGVVRAGGTKKRKVRKQRERDAPDVPEPFDIRGGVMFVKR